MIIYHIAKNEGIQKVLEGENYSGDSLISEGFIHCSSADQVIDVVNQRFKGQGNLVLLYIETDLVRPEIRFENLEGGKKLFPHIYGAVNRDAIRKMVKFSPGNDGLFVLPADIEAA